MNFNIVKTITRCSVKGSGLTEAQAGVFSIATLIVLFFLLPYVLQVARCGSLYILATLRWIDMTMRGHVSARLFYRGQTVNPLWGIDTSELRGGNLSRHRYAGQTIR